MSFYDIIHIIDAMDYPHAADDIYPDNLQDLRRLSVWIDDI